MSDECLVCKDPIGDERWGGAMNDNPPGAKIHERCMDAHLNTWGASLAEGLRIAVKDAMNPAIRISLEERIRLRAIAKNDQRFCSSRLDVIQDTIDAMLEVCEEHKS